MTDPEKVEAMPCPSCGRKTLDYWRDPNGEGGQCASMDCLEVCEIDELMETTDD